MMAMRTHYHVKRESLRLANGDCFVVTRESWKRFLARLENNLLTVKPKSQYPPASEVYQYTRNGMV